MNEETKDKFKIHDTIITWACIIWAIASIVLMFYFTGLNKVTFSIMTFGQLFLVMGIIGITRKNISGVVLTITGLSTIIIAAINEWGYLINNNREVWLFPTMVSTAITVIGLGMMIVPGRIEKRSAKRCKVEVSAECVDFKSTELREGMMYAPVYMYSFNGKEYVKCTNKYRREKEVNIGDTTTLKINEKNPEEIYFEINKASKMLIYIIGASFFILGFGILLTIWAER